MSRQKVRYLFIATMVFLPLQYLLVGIIGSIRSEPWPAFVFPGFKNVYHTADIITLRNPVFHGKNTDGSYSKLPTSAILKGIPHSHHRQLLRFQFDRFGVDHSKNIKFLSEDGIQWLDKQLEYSGYSDYKSADIILVWTSETYRVVDNKLMLIRSEGTDTIRIATRDLPRQK
jgi:hypothetical protein